MKNTGQKDGTFRAAATPWKAAAQDSFGRAESESRGTIHRIASTITTVGAP